VRNFLFLDMSEVILNSIKKNNGVRTSAIPESRVAKLFIAILANYCFWSVRGWGR
jgi:hypothetical protein